MRPKVIIKATDGVNTEAVNFITAPAASVDPNNVLDLGGGIPQNIQTVDYTTVLSDANGQVYHPLGAGAGDTFTIAANASVAYPIGTAITFINMATDDLDVDIATDTLNYVNVGAVTTITVPQYNMVTAVKITSTAWLASGTAGVTTA